MPRKATKSRHVKQPAETCTVDELLTTFTSLQATKGRQQHSLTYQPIVSLFFEQSLTQRH